MLNLSKILMHNFYYNYNKNKYGDKYQILLTDVFSFMYKFETEIVYEYFYKNKELFELINSSIILIIQII